MRPGGVIGAGVGFPTTETRGSENVADRRSLRVTGSTVHCGIVKREETGTGIERMERMERKQRENIYLQKADKILQDPCHLDRACVCA